MGYLFFCAISIFFNPSFSFAWDYHSFLTRETLHGFEFSHQTLWKKLNSTLEIRPIEGFIEHVFGPRCSLKTFKDVILRGVGERYEVRYVKGFSYTVDIDIANGINQVKLTFINQNWPFTNPLDIISTYSDEPDWQMDDDVPSLKGKGPVPETTGTAMRLLRHFWYEGQKVGDELLLDKDQETDQRIQLFYELALIAFDNGEDYWGYRFLGIALHYLQDITQPFHSLAIINEDMLDTQDIRRGLLCDWQRILKQWAGTGKPPHCLPKDTLNAAAVRSAFIITAYHAIFEDFARGLLDHNFYNTRNLIASTSTNDDMYGTVSTLPWNINRKNENGADSLEDLKEIIRTIQRSSIILAQPLGKLAFDVFGHNFKYDLTKTEAELRVIGSNHAFGYDISTFSDYSMDMRGLSESRLKKRNELIEITNALLRRAGIWGRQFIQTTLQPLTLPQHQKLMEIRQKMAQQCQQ